MAKTINYMGRVDDRPPPPKPKVWGGDDDARIYLTHDHDHAENIRLAAN